MIKNILANFIGKFWSLFAIYIFTPIYIKLLGLNNFGLISFYTIILSFVGVMDAGLSATLSREFAKKSTDDSQFYKLKSLKTLETVYFIGAGIIIISFLFLAPIIALQWLKINSINGDKAERCILYMGLMAVAQILINFYSGGLIGLEKQVKANMIQVLLGVFRNAFVILILIFIQYDIEYFFLWQLTVSIIFAIVIRFILIHELSNNFTLPNSIGFDKIILKNISAFAGGMFLISVVASINTQLDKLLISKIMSIQDLGYYTLATTFSQVILAIGAPFSTALFPRFTGLYSLSKKTEAEQLFYSFLKLISVLISPLSIVLIFFAQPILGIWINDPSITEKCINIIPYTVVGAYFLAIVVLPYCIVLANGYTKLNNILGICSIFITIPAYYFGIKFFGAVAAAMCWSVTQVGITLIFNYFVNKKYFSLEPMWKWFLNYAILPFIVSLIIILPFYVTHPYVSGNKYVSVMWILTTLLCSTFCTFIYCFRIFTLKDFKTNFLEKINIQY